ncbi:hypothetical protein CTI12_AA377290 [Artemisia annua]|uniref:Ulp1 protease family, C-terminal catalytic domain-containing protein n=1 Tax=Artemisia annua TaxID=35608 RepID=A0A2U1MIG9_ARTAN|nr:hypothetical protein CTI12_AA377290 [Artemisia annua]
MSDPLDTHNTSGNKGITKGSSKSKARDSEEPEVSKRIKDKPSSGENQYLCKEDRRKKSKVIYAEIDDTVEEEDVEEQEFICSNDDEDSDISDSDTENEILECYNVEEKYLVLKGHEIKITRDLVHEILGFPKGDLRIHFEKRTSYKKMNLYLDNFWNQYKDVVKTKDRTFSTNLKDIILAINEVNDVFKLNFIILLVTTMISSCNRRESNMKFLQSLAPYIDNFVGFDWCSLMMDSLALKHDLSTNSASNQYCGPLTFLTILECYNVEEKSLVLKEHEIKITRDLVHEILGFPKGDLRIHFEKRTSYKKMNLYLDNFWNQYKDVVKTKDRTFSTNLKDIILAINEVNDVFKLNFIILLVTTMISSCNRRESNMKFLQSLAPYIDNFVGFDWCSLMMDSLALKHDLSTNSASNQYCGISGNECGLKDVCESSKSREVGIDFPVNDDYNNLVVAPVTEDEPLLSSCNHENNNWLANSTNEIQQVHSNKIDTSKEEQLVSPNSKLLLLFIGKDTPQIQTSSHEVSDLAISDQFVVDTTDTVANEEGDKEEENLSEESEKLDLVVKKVAEDIILVSKDDSVDIEQSSAERVDTANVSVKTNVTTNADFQNVNAMDFENEFSTSVSVREEVLPVNDISVNEDVLTTQDYSKMEIPTVDSTRNAVEEFFMPIQHDGCVEIQSTQNDNSKTDETEVFNTENDEEPTKENIVNIDEELPSNSTNALFIDLQVNDADSVSILQDDVSLSNGASGKMQLEVADISNVGIPTSENASNIEGDSVEGNVTMKDDLSAAFENDGFFESPKNEEKADEGLDKEVNDNLQENVFAGNDQNVTSETFLLQESEKSKVDIEQPLAETMDTINVGSHVTTDTDFNVQSHSGEKRNVDVMDVPNEFSTECTEIDATEVQNVDAMCVQNVDAMNLQNDFSTSVMVGEELLQNVTMKEDLSADSGNGGCLEIQKNEDSDTISCIPYEASEKEINEHIDDKTRAVAEEHDLPTQDGLVVQTDVSSNADFHVDIIGVQNEVSAGDFQSKFVEFPESQEGQSNDEIFTEDSKKENDKFEIDSAFPVTAELQREIQIEDTSNIQMETLDVQNAGCLKIKDFEECDTISEIQEPTNDSSHSLPLEGIDMQMDNGNPISKTLPKPNENVFAMNENVKTIDSPHSLAMERSEMHIDEVPSASQKGGSGEMICDTSMSACEEVHLDRGILMKVNIEEEIPSASQKGGSGEMMCHTNAKDLVLNEPQTAKCIKVDHQSEIKPKDIDEYNKDSEEKVKEFNNYVKDQNGYAVILDNLKSDATYDGKYKKVFEFVKSLLVDFLAQNNFTTTNLFLCEKDAKVLNLRWKTRNDKINCGLYAMIHMEHYEFEDEEWEIGILDEEDAQHRIQMDVLRNRYITKILLHEINQHKRKMIHFAENWISENPDEFEEEGT